MHEQTIKHFLSMSKLKVKHLPHTPCSPDPPWSLFPLVNCRCSYRVFQKRETVISLKGYDHQLDDDDEDDGC